MCVWCKFFWPVIFDFGRPQCLHFLMDFSDATLKGDISANLPRGCVNVEDDCGRIGRGASSGQMTKECTWTGVVSCWVRFLIKAAC